MSPHVTFLCLCILCQVLGAEGEVYCWEVNNCSSIQNIVCQRNLDCSGTDYCKSHWSSQETRKYILKSLNEYRRDVALGHIPGLPSASNMLRLQWDNDLEYTTRCALNTCEKRDEVCANTSKYSYTITLLIYMPFTRETSGDDRFFKNVFKTTWLYQRGLTKGQIDYYTNPSFSHFAAILSGESPAVACAVYRNNGFNYGACTFAVGPQYGDRIYRRGAPCTRCPIGLRCSNHFPGLCQTVSSGTIMVAWNIFIVEILFAVAQYVL